MPGEDPFLSGEYANFFVNGCQTGPDPRYLKMSAGRCGWAANVCVWLHRVVGCAGVPAPSLRRSPCERGPGVVVDLSWRRAEALHRVQR